MVEGKQKFALWITPEAKATVEEHYRRDNCKSQSEYIEKAVRFYSGYLDAENAGAFLPRVLSDTLEGKLGALGDRLGRLLFKMVVEESMMMNVVAAAINVSRDDLDKLRARCVKDAKETRGLIKFDEAYDYQHQVE